MPSVTDWQYNDIEGYWEWIEEEAAKDEKIIEDDLKYAGKEINKDLEYVEDEMEIPRYYEEDTDDFHDFWQYLFYYRWIINFFLAGIPYFIVSIVANGFNIWWNIYLNDWWAEGNVYLMWNTAYSVLMTLISLIVVFEIPYLLQVTKVLRMFAFMVSVIYAFTYASFFLKFRGIIKEA